MRIVFGLLIFVLTASFAGFLLSAFIGIIVGVELIMAGSIVGGCIAIGIGIAINAAMLLGAHLEAKWQPYVFAGDEAI